MTEPTTDDLRQSANQLLQQMDGTDWGIVQDELREAADRIDALEAGVRGLERDNLAKAERIDELEQRLYEIKAIHRPQWVDRDAPGFTWKPQEGRDPVGCIECYPSDGSWPCATRMCCDDCVPGRAR